MRYRAIKYSTGYSVCAPGFTVWVTEPHTLYGVKGIDTKERCYVIFIPNTNKII